jgi:exonuclease SbcC
VRLLDLELQNFRQHARTAITFSRGLTGIIGPNGAGKSTILEAIAWALYGNAAARGTRDSIRFTRAERGASVRVTLSFELAGHRYRITRGLTSAECHLDDAPGPVANTITGVTELVQQRLGMTRDEFFNTYFTGQKELDGMRTMGAAERAQFLSRVLGYERLSTARDVARERRRSLVGEIAGVKQGMPDAEAVWRMVEDAEARLAAARERVRIAEERQREAADALATLAPEWSEAQERRDRSAALEQERRVLARDREAARREIERCDRELAVIADARATLAPMSAELRGLPTQREALRAFAQLAQADGRRTATADALRVVDEEVARLEERLARLESAPVLEQQVTEELTATRAAATALDEDLERQRTDWVRDRQEAETRLEALRQQYADIKQQRDTLAELGADGPCPTCGRPLGASWQAVLEDLGAQEETVRVDGTFFKARVEQLRVTPPPVVALEERRRALATEVATLERRLTRILAGVQERSAVTQELETKRMRAAQLRVDLAALPAGYDRARHSEVEREVERLTELERRAERLSAAVDRSATLDAERAAAVAAHEAIEARERDLATRSAALAWSAEQYEMLRERHDRASTAARLTERDALTAQADVAAVRGELDAAERSRRDLVRLEARLTELTAEKRLHDELDRTYTDLRTDLNHALRPELADIASGFLAELTDGRYDRVDLDEDYRLVVFEDGLPKPVISGGEEDLANLVLRLAISQMIAERAGQAFSLLVLDEVFGSLDDVRRQHVVALLRRLHDRFEQVIVITHIDDVRDGLDHTLMVHFDEERGAARVEAMSAAAPDGRALADDDDLLLAGAMDDGR